jgi:hypothetical protein
MRLCKLGKDYRQNSLCDILAQILTLKQLNNFAAGVVEQWILSRSAAEKARKPIIRPRIECLRSTRHQVILLMIPTS